MDSYTLFSQQIADAVKAYPELIPSVRDGFKFLRGTFRIIDDDGKEWNKFQIEIRFKECFPHCFPELVEVGDKIPKIPDWHINENGGCCITIPLLEVASSKNGITVLQFIQNHVRAC